ncbi:nucleotidyltransferase domain-containing protein [Catenuloplanes sp. NPDC020197]|uniref:Nucleotidyltransferase n=1 Tax=Catenuloplanes niger TaxID=587534 RepID=A0AAE3ZXJ2_9ACTN|nr:nucleotidyltransferase domain-containing protein [Catenuloplanes niger]MDR7327889.1 putative nucleotidyltransferase [Catenuloplanes niger]
MTQKSRAYGVPPWWDVRVKDARLIEIADRLAGVGGVAAVVLGGSRARGTHRPDSDYDLGLYYRGDLDVAALRTLAADVTGADTEVTARGGWGPWVDGGGWLTVDGARVDWIYRDLGRAERIRADCEAGRFEIGFQPGHPLGFYSHVYAGEVALCRPLAVTDRSFLDLRAKPYPPALGDALVAGLWEAGFMLEIAAKTPDPVYRAGCMFRLVGVVCQAMHGHAGRWLINEKGMVESAAALPGAPAGFAGTARAAVRDLDAGSALLGMAQAHVRRDTVPYQSL